MADCCDTSPRASLEMLPAGLSTLPRQLRTFGEVRRVMLAGLPKQPALRSWKPSGDDLGLMWLEMWAYVADTLAFYDARVADASYLGTAPSRVALRRIVGLLGYSPRGGIAGRATLAVLAKGVPTVLPAGTGFRSAAIAGQPPQVFESNLPVAIDSLKNLWTVKPFKRNPRVDPAASSATSTVGSHATKGGSSSSSGSIKAGNGSSGPPATSHLLFEPEGYGLTVDSLVLFESRSTEFPSAVVPKVTQVATSAPFAGRDDASYVRVTFAPAISVESELNLNDLRVRTPTQSFVATTHTPKTSGKSTASPIMHSGSSSVVYVDGMPGRFRVHDPIIVAKDLGGPEPKLAFVEVGAVEAAALEVSVLPPADDGSRPMVAGTRLTLSPGFGTELGTDGAALSFFHAFVGAGRPTNVAQTTVSLAELCDPAGVPLGTGLKPPAPTEAMAQQLGLANSTAGILEQRFLISDAGGQSASVSGRITFLVEGSAHFELLDPTEVKVSLWKLPMRIYGNLVDATRGESVPREVLGSGDASQVNQSFKLKKKPLTYLPGSGGEGNSGTTLNVWVDGIRWREVPSHFGSGPEDRVYCVRQNDDGESTVHFGDGVFGARVPTGVGNVVASYRYGAGFLAPPSNAINQLGRAAEGLQGVASPLPAQPGKDPEGPDDLRASAPRSVLMLGRVVGILDFEAMAAAAPGVVRAAAEWRWLKEQMQAGVHVDYIGDAEESFIVETLRHAADPTIPLAVVRAVPIVTRVSIAIEVNPRFQKSQVERAVYHHLTTTEGALSPSRAQIGGHYWAGTLHRAVLEVDGVLGVAGLTFTSDHPDLSISATDGACLPASSYLDFRGTDAVTVTGVDPKGGGAALVNGFGGGK